MGTLKLRFVGEILARDVLLYFGNFVLLRPNAIALIDSVILKDFDFGDLSGEKLNAIIEYCDDAADIELRAPCIKKIASIEYHQNLYHGCCLRCGIYYFDGIMRAKVDYMSKDAQTLVILADHSKLGGIFDIKATLDGFQRLYSDLRTGKRTPDEDHEPNTLKKTHEYCTNKSCSQCRGYAARYPGFIMGMPSEDGKENLIPCDMCNSKIVKSTPDSTMGPNRLKLYP